MGCVVQRGEIGALADGLKQAGRKITLTNGCFDLLHVGHLRYLQAAKALGDVLIVGVNADATVRALKGRGRPLVAAEERVELLAGLVPVDYAFIFPEATAVALLAEIQPAFYVKGGDYQPWNLPEADAVTACGAQLVLVPYIPGRSTTNLLALAAEQGNTESPEG